MKNFQYLILLPQTLYRYLLNFYILLKNQKENLRYWMASYYCNKSKQWKIVTYESEKVLAKGEHDFTYIGEHH